jgi:mannose-6-phosphate isomerase-like protein (cupin superfamily)
MVDFRVADSREETWGEDPRFPGVALQLLISKIHTPAASMIRVKVSPGAVIDTHTHETETELVYVQAGSAVLVMAGEEFPIAAGMCVAVPPGIAHSLRNTGAETVDLIAVHSPPTR